jgi:hypothetical protein
VAAWLELRVVYDWNRLEPVGTGWNRLEPVGTGWDQMEPVGTSWNRLEPVLHRSGKIFVSFWNGTTVSIVCVVQFSLLQVVSLCHSKCLCTNLGNLDCFQSSAIDGNGSDHNIGWSSRVPVTKLVSHGEFLQRASCFERVL